MNILIQYGTAVTAVPTAALGVLDRATQTDMRVLLAVCSDPALTAAASLGGCVTNIAAAVGCSAAQVESALAFWRGAGILSLREGQEETSASASEAVTARASETKAMPSATEALPSNRPAALPKTAEKTEASAEKVSKPSRRDDLPHYTSEEMAHLLEERTDVKDNIDECQRIWGKVFNIKEVNVLLGLSDYLGLDWEYIMTLVAYCAKMRDKQGYGKSLHYVETTAFSFYNEGIFTVPALTEKLRSLEALADIDGQLRSLFGMGNRAQTPKEKKLFSTWVHDFGYGMDIIRMAYEVTVDAKGSPNLSYMNSVLANWNSRDLRTVEAVEANQAAFRAEQERLSSAKAGAKTAAHAAGRSAGKAPDSRNTPSGEGGSFDTEDFFAAAVRRSLGEDFDPVSSTNQTGESNGI